MPIEDGILSTDGWTLIDDSKGLLFDDSEWAWVTERPSGEGQDWYFMAYGHNYKAALKDFTTFAGKVPLPPRYAFGYWWSRYWSYSDDELRDLTAKFDAYDIPLDVLVIDMDWHYVNPGRGGWTGYTWNRSLFPNPAQFLQYLKGKKLQVTLNLHPAGGIEPYEERYKDMANWMGMDPSSKQRIDYCGSDKRFMSGWLNTILRPMEKEGVDFWWLDWQQDMFDRHIKTLNNTWWLNYVLFSDKERDGRVERMRYMSLNRKKFRDQVMIRVLKYFLAVAREGSITGAANSLHLTQPTLTRQLQELEKELSTTDREELKRLLERERQHQVMSEAV